MGKCRFTQPKMPDSMLVRRGSFSTVCGSCAPAGVVTITSGADLDQMTARDIHLYFDVG